MSLYSYTAADHIISGNPPKVSHLLAPDTDSNWRIKIFTI